MNFAGQEKNKGWGMQSLKLNLEDNITSKVIKLEDFWTKRSEEYPFYTLGKCAYLDGKTEDYYKDSRWQNVILSDEFYHLYLKVMGALSALLSEEVHMTEDLAVPGFHIFPSNEKFLTFSGKWHQDIPHVTLGLDGKDPYSFTLPIKLPTGGGGLDVINDEGEEEYIEYEEGKLMLSDGMRPHRISTLKEYVPWDLRITLQGHIFRRNGKLEAYF